MEGNPLSDNSDNTSSPTSPLSQKTKRILIVTLCILALVAGVIILKYLHISSGNLFGFKNPPNIESPAPISGLTLFASKPVDIPFTPQTIAIAPGQAQDFSIDEIQNLQDIEKAYGVTFTASDLRQFQQDKFIVKNLLDTNITLDPYTKSNSLGVADNSREFVELYSRVIGSYDYKERTQANSVFISSDVLFNLFSILSVDLLKETENKYLYPQILYTTQILFNDASNRLKSSSSNDEHNRWTKVRNYFAVPYALLSTVLKPVTAEDYWDSDRSTSINDLLTAYQEKDATADSYENAVSFVKNLRLDADSESRVLSDLSAVTDASRSSLPAIFSTEYSSIPGPIQFKIPFSVFKPRGAYTSSSLRRQYFRAVQWYQQIPFFLSSKDLTNYALDIGQLLRDTSDLLEQNDSTLSLLEVLTGKSDDLDAGDYAAAIADLGPNARNEQKLSSYFDNKTQSRIKSLPAFYPSIGEIPVADVLEATRGMRFFSQKFTPDSYWTSKLTQGDEQPAVNGMKLPGEVSSLEVMSILGSSYAKSQLPSLPFYNLYKQAVHTRLADLISEASSWGEAYWKGNQYTSTLWSIAGLFDWLQTNRPVVPRFMQSPLWDVKTLLTGSAFWTELRHTNILYAKQSFAEIGAAGGDDTCDTRTIPPPPKGYIEPQPEAYDRLYYTARKLYAEYNARGFGLKNLDKLQQYISLLDIVREYTKLELQNTAFNEPLTTITRQKSDGKNCVENQISSDAAMRREKNYITSASRWEELRTDITHLMKAILPNPIEGPILPIKDKRAAVIADVHTSEEGILEEGTGVPRVIFVAVKDVNGPRLTIGFIYSQYELTSPDRLTDEQWQDNFYTDSDDDYRITYKPGNAWPAIPAWYQKLIGTK